jgi:hypothetical protein
LEFYQARFPAICRLPDAVSCVMALGLRLFPPALSGLECLDTESKGVTFRPMTKTRTALGFVAGVMLVLSSVAHTFLGWPSQAAELAKTTTPADLATGLEIGWKWGGVAILVFGVIVIATFLKRQRGERVWMLPAALVAVSYLAFGSWALYRSNFDSFFFVFVVPGVLLGVAVSGD